MKSAPLAMVATLFALALFGASAQARPAPSGLPSVLCKKEQSTFGEGKTIPGIYSYRPHNCLTHKYQLARPALQLYAKIKWAYWNAEEAFGRGGIPGEEIDIRNNARSLFYDPTTVRLVAPLRVCGKLIFTAAVFDYVEEEFVYHEQLDRLPVPGTGCPRATG